MKKLRHKIKTHNRPCSGFVLAAVNFTGALVRSGSRFHSLSFNHKRITLKAVYHLHKKGLPVLISRFKWIAAVYSLLAAIGLSCTTSAGELRLGFHDDNGDPLADVVAALLPAIAQTNPQDSTPAVMDQRDNQFVPHVIAVRTNTLVHFPNSDNVRHHVYSFSPAKRFELRLYHGTTAEPVLFDKPGQVVLGCNIHDSMLAYIYVVDTALFAVSNAQGTIDLSGIPPGDYQLQIQHPRHGEPLIRALTVTADSAVEERIVLARLQPDPRDAAPASELEALFKR